MPPKTVGQNTAAASTDTQTTGKGMPERTPQDGSARVDRAQTAKDASAEASLSLPHERDQKTAMTPAQPAATMRQAKRDVDAGLQDTSKQPEMNAAYNKQKQAGS